MEKRNGKNKRMGKRKKKDMVQQNTSMRGYKRMEAHRPASCRAREMMEMGTGANDTASTGARLRYSHAAKALAVPHYLADSLQFCIERYTRYNNTLLIHKYINRA